jgi:hypothetical protein
MAEQSDPGLPAITQHQDPVHTRSVGVRPQLEATAKQLAPSKHETAQESVGSVDKRHQQTRSAFTSTEAVVPASAGGPQVG